MEARSLPANAAIFSAAALAIWWAGRRLEKAADQLAVETGLGRAFVGVALLATATSLPEVATTVSAVVILGNPSLAVHNLLGGVALQTGLLVLADLAQRDRGALTYFSPRYSLLLQGLGLVLLLQLAIAAIAAKGAPVVWSVSSWSVLLLLLQLAIMYATYRHRGRPRWTPAKRDDAPPGERPRPAPEEGADDRFQGRIPIRRLWLAFGGWSAVVLVGGWLATESADALATQTGLGSAFLGATLLAAATSMPEISTTFAAARTGRYTLAISNIFGSNTFCVALLFLADALYRGGSIFAHAEPTVTFVAALGAVMTCLYLWGLLERQDKTLGRLGWDSVAALLAYAGGVAVLYLMQ